MSYEQKHTSNSLFFCFPHHFFLSFFRLHFFQKNTQQISAFCLRYGSNYGSRVYMMETPTQCPWCFVEFKVYKVAAKKPKFAMVYQKKERPQPKSPKHVVFEETFGDFWRPRNLETKFWRYKFDKNTTWKSEKGRHHLLFMNGWMASPYNIFWRDLDLKSIRNSVTRYKIFKLKNRSSDKKLRHFFSLGVGKIISNMIGSGKIGVKLGWCFLSTFCLEGFLHPFFAPLGEFF